MKYLTWNCLEAISILNCNLKCANWILTEGSLGVTIVTKITIKTMVVSLHSIKCNLIKSMHNFTWSNLSFMIIQIFWIPPFHLSNSFSTIPWNLALLDLKNDSRWMLSIMSIILSITWHMILVFSFKNPLRIEIRNILATVKILLMTKVTLIKKLSAS